MIFKMLPLVIAVVLMTPFIIDDTFAQIVAGPSNDSSFERDFGDIKYIDAYFGTPEKKIQVDGGDHNVPFTVVLVNIGSSDITGISGQLSLPLGFSSSSSAGTNTVIYSDSNANALTGENFYLTFSVNIDQNVPIQEYPGTIKVDYSRLRESGVRTTFVNLEFKVTGDSVINVKSAEPFLTSLKSNDIVIEITNDGTAPISSVNIVVANTQSDLMAPSANTNVQEIVVSDSSWQIGNVNPQSTAYISTSVYAPESLIGETVHIPLSITYYDAYGQEQQISKSVDLYVLQATDDRVINVKSTEPFLTSLKSNDIVIEITNDGTDPISNVNIVVENAQSDLMAPSQSTNTNVDKVVMSDSSWYVEDIDSQSTAYISTTVYVPESLTGNTLHIPLSITYHDVYGEARQISKSSDFYVQGLIDLTIFNVDVIELSGIQVIVGEIINEGNEDGLFGFVSIEPGDASNIKPNTQFIDEIETDAPVPFNVPIEFEGEPRYGEHDITITLRYKNSLRDEIFLTQQQTVFINEPVIEETSPVDSGAIAAGIVIVAVIVAVFVITQRRRRAADDG